jgi:hypothetical protein
MTIADYYQAWRTPSTSQSNADYSHGFKQIFDSLFGRQSTHENQRRIRSRGAVKPWLNGH